MRAWKITSCVCLLLLVHPAQSGETQQNWTHFVRIGAYGLHDASAADTIVRDAQNDHVFGIEIDNDITGRYESFLDPTAKLKAIRAVAERAHKAGNKAFVYIAGTECITANADKSAHSMAKDHPGWLQRKRTGEPAVFTSGAAFWIRPGDEDVWISPFASDWRKIYMERVRQIAQTGIDGIYVDIPYWMTHFDGWEDSWASFDDHTVRAFKQKTGLDARKDLRLGDFSDGNFRKWIDFRIATLTDFVREIRENARTVNPQIMMIPEIYPGFEEEATRVGADVYQMYGVSDTIAHEYEFGSGDHMASSRKPLDWFLYQAGMMTFRAFAEGKATWILNYSWDGDKNVAAREGMKTLAMSEVLAGANFWDAPGHTMAGSNDPATRREIFAWIAANEKILYSPREAVAPVGVYFSPASRNYDPAQFLPSYRGMLLLLLERHLEVQVVTPRTLRQFRGKTLILPGATVADPELNPALERFVAAGGKVIVTGSNGTSLAPSGNVRLFPDCPGRAHFAELEKDFAHPAAVPDDFLRELPAPETVVQAPSSVVTHIASVGGKPHFFIVNFSGIVPHQNVKPEAVSGITIRTAAGGKAVAHFLPFLGKPQVIPSRQVGGKLEFELPAVERGGIAWIE